MVLKVLLLTSLLLITHVSAMEIDVEINKMIDGYMPWLNATITTPQKFSVSWENTGSVPCRSSARIDFLNGSRVIYTSWGPKTVMKQGDVFTWNLYSYLMQGEYNYTVTVTHCNEQYMHDPYSFTANNESPIEDVIKIVGCFADDDGVEVFVSSSMDLENIIIIPEKYPLGWVFESGKIDNIRSGQVMPVRINYEPVNWEGETISLVAVTEDGNYREKKPVILKRSEFNYPGMILVCVFLAAMVIYLYYKKIKFLVWKG